MTEFPDGIVIEARKAGLKQAKRKAADGSWFDVHDITFEIHPNDTNSPLSNMPLGTRVALVVTQLHEEDAAEAPGEQTAPETGEDVGLDEADLSGHVDRSTANWSEAKRKMVQRAALVCKEPAFQQYVASLYPPHDDSNPEDRAARHVRHICVVKSRADIDPIGNSGSSFRDIMRWYEQAQSGRTDPEVARQFAEGPG